MFIEQRSLRELWVHTFFKNISPKANLIARYQLELVNSVFTIQNVSHNTKRIPPLENRCLKMSISFVDIVYIKSK